VECGDVPSMQHAMHIQRQRRNRTQEPEGKIDKKKSKSLLNVFKAKDDKGNTSSQSSFDDAQYANENPPYESVVRQNLMFCRPLIILGPLAELLNDRLVNDAPDIFCRCILYTTRPQQKGEQNGREFYFVSQDRIKAIQNNGEDKFVECKHIGGHAFYTSASAIKDVAKQNKHCVLNVGVYAIERMQSTDLFPIVVFLKFRSAQDIRDQFNHRCSLEQAQKVFDKAVKLERGYSDKFTAMVSGSSLEEIFTKIHEVVKMNSSNVMWTKQ